MAKRLGLGTVLARNSTGSTYVDVGEVTNVDGPAYSMEALDASHLDSPDKFMQFKAGMSDGGEVAVTCHFDPDTGAANVQNSIREDLENQVEKNYRISFAAAAGATPRTVIMKCLVTGFAPAAPVADLMGVSITLKVSEKPVWS